MTDKLREMYVDATDDSEAAQILYDLARRECRTWCSQSTSEHTVYCKRAQKVIHGRIQAEWDSWHK
jgi:hypothetical protein